MHSRGSVLGRSRSMQARSLAAGSGRASVAHPCRRSTAAASVATAAAAPQAAQAASPQPEDKWIARTLAPLHGQPAHSSLEALRQSSAAALATARMPSTRNEEYRFTDITPLLKATVQPADASAEVSAALVDALVFPEAAASVAVVVNGVLRPSLSRLGGLPEGVYVGSLSGAPPAALAALGSLTNARGGPMQVLNGAAAQEVTVVSIPAGLSACPPLYVLHVATGTGRGEATRHGNAPRLLVHAGEGSTFEVVEEFVARDGGHGGYFTCAVAELLLEQNAHLQHRYVQGEADGSFHFRGTLVSQAAHSSYTHTEVSLGGALTRHDLIIEQAGSATHTEMRHFLLCGSDQLHDLHSKLELNHPNGTANQLHKCIVGAPTGRGVFDGNVKVNKRAQKTDAGQLSRNLLLVPRATVNVKPNLQIVADDVKCTHGCTVSDLSEEELFYFRARGISAESARQALVYSFGAECVDGIRYKALKERIQQGVRATLSAVDFVAAAKPAADGQ